MKALGIVALVLAVLAVPALAVLVGTARGYLDTTADVAAIRVEIVELRLSNDTTRTFAGPDVVLRVSGVSQTNLTFEEVNFDLRWQGERVAIVSSFPRLTIPRGGSLSVTVNSNLDADRAEAMRALLASGERGFAVVGNARIGLPNGAGSVWLTLQGQVRAGGTGVADGAVTVRDRAGRLKPRLSGRTRCGGFPATKPHPQAGTRRGLGPHSLGGALMCREVGDA